MSGVQYKGLRLTLGRCKAPFHGEGQARPGGAGHRTRRNCLDE